MRLAPALLLAAACGSNYANGPTAQEQYAAGSYTIGMTQSDVLYSMGQPKLIKYVGPNIEEWVYDGERKGRSRDDIIDPQPFPKDPVNMRAPRLVLHFENRILVKIMERKPGEPN